DYRALHGRWPAAGSGPIASAPGETWRAIEGALRAGVRGLTGGTSLARLLEQHRGHRKRGTLPRLTHEQILAWADAHHAAHGRWPEAGSGPITGAPGETWHAMQAALGAGRRGLSGGMTLARLLEQHRSHRKRSTLPGLTVEQILAWADAHHAAHGRWPNKESGP